MNLQGIKFLIRWRLKLIGLPDCWEGKSHKAGHFLNNQLCRKVLSDKSNYEIVKISELTSIQEDIYDIDGFALPSLA